MNYVMFQRVADRLREDGLVHVLLYAEDDHGRDVYPIYKDFGFEKEDIVPRWHVNLKHYDMIVCADPGIPKNRFLHLAGSVLWRSSWSRAADAAAES